MANDLGVKGEDIARKWLVKQQFEILDSNWRFGHKELDIVATKDGVLHVVEVKTREAGYLDDPRDAVGARKQKNIIEAADAYVAEHDITTDVCFDIIFITATNGGIDNIEYIEDAFTPYG